MSERDWVKHAAFGAIGLAVFGAFLFFAWQTRPNLKPEDIAHDFVWNCDQKHAPNAQIKNDAAPKQPPKTRLQIAEENKANAENAARAKAECEAIKREESDLRAQWVAAESARSNYWLALVNFIALILTLGAAAWAAWASQKSANATVEAVRLAREQFIAAHRPRIKVRHVALTDISIDAPIQCAIVFANVGDTPATTFRLAVDCFLITPDGEETPADNMVKIEKQKIIPGRELRFFRNSSRSYNSAQLEGIRDGIFTLCISATLLYKDKNGTVRSTGLCRMLDAENRVFLPFPNERKFTRYQEDEYQN
ncbi:hypothetical protein OVA03_15415 [Asticcacaulis sp. SL142]|uniref:hypothetical protein n=1 Tax=Asticcacaulis sp. SL142 TaxID=2995155 RepID=UPI00226C7A60|nr:hypothetical protein [Asticcacaulis sp. SL142]WAC48064.1 hypothetical protein OVA03_15415 [Asticcacaulis sp. SL142]